ncbi:MAG: methyltransferase domain-containing protein [Parasphingorhabdus sp.]
MPNEDQREYWNDSAGAQWVAEQELMDAMLAKVTASLISQAAPQSGERVLDIGCGTGETSLIAADAGAQVTGVDISEPMLALAAKRLGDRGETILADASEYQDETGFDLIMSRFGVMFFDDPRAAFTNINSNLKPEGRMSFACWRAPQENDWVLVPMMAVRPYLPETPEQDPHAPGPFAFADPERTKAILQNAGFADIVIEPVDIEMVIADKDGIDQALDFITKIGPAARAMAEVDAAGRDKMLSALKEALSPHNDNGRIALKGAIWLVQAKQSV